MKTLMVDSFGAFVGKKSERVQVRQKGKVVEEHPFFELERIVIASPGVSISSDLLYECVTHGLPVDFLTYSGKPYARLSSPELMGTVLTRREQILAYEDERGLSLAKCFAGAKVRNQAALLKYFGKYRKKADPALYSMLCDRAEKIKQIETELTRINSGGLDDNRTAILNVEARCAREYWQAFESLVPAEVDFEGREKRGAKDPVNMLLNYGYGILYSRIWSAIELAGLDPFAGFLHADRSGKPSLILDLIEEFRQQAVDRTVFGLVNRGYEPRIDKDGLLEKETRRELSKKVMERLDSGESYEGKKHPLRAVIQLQARRLASFFRGERDYRGFVGGW